MSAPTKKDLQDAIAAYNPSDSRPAFAKAFEISGCASMKELLDSPEKWPTLIAEMNRLTAEVAAQQPPKQTAYDIILAAIEALPESCGYEARKTKYTQILGAADSLRQAEVDQLLTELKKKCTGAKIDSLRKELDDLRPETRAVKRSLPESAEPVLFRCHEEDQIYGGVWDAATGKFVKGWELTPLNPGSPGIEQIYGLFSRAPPTSERLPSGAFAFRPGVTPQLTKTLTGYEVNRWKPSEYVEAAVHSAIVPPAILKLLTHVLGDDPKVVERFLNWLAVILQTHGRAGTGWVITGAEGTGKGILFEDVIGLLLGMDYCPDLTSKDVEDQFNSWAKTCRALNIDEAKIAGFQAPRTLGVLRRLITAATTPVREMHKAIVHHPNYANVILTSNDDQPLKLSPGDRRYNVSPYQRKKLGAVVEDIAAFRKQIKAELPAFAGYLLSYEINKERASEPMDTRQRETMIENSASTPEKLVRAFKEGDLDWFIDSYMTNTEDACTGLRVRDHELLTGVRKALGTWTGKANSADAKRLSETKISAGQIAAFHNFLMPEKFWRSPMDIHHMVGDELPSARSNWGRGYRVWWRTKKTAAELERFAHALEHPNTAAQKEFDAIEKADERPEHKKPPRARKPPSPPDEPATVAAAPPPPKPTASASVVSEPAPVWEDDPEGPPAVECITPPKPAKANGVHAPAPPAPDPIETLFEQLRKTTHTAEQLAALRKVAGILVREALKTPEAIVGASPGKLSAIKEFRPKTLAMIQTLAREARARAAMISIQEKSTATENGGTSHVGPTQ